MRSKKLRDAFSYVEDSYLDAAEQQKQSACPRWHRWVAAAACLCILLGSLTLLPGVRLATPLAVNTVLAQARYPQMERYVDLADYTNANGETNWNQYNEAYSKWLESWRSRRESCAGDVYGLEDFLVGSTAEFLTEKPGENVVYSPLNVYMALAMLAETTRGPSRQEILDLLGAKDLESLRTQAGQVWNANYFDDGASVSILANSLWLRDDMEYNRQTMENLAEHYYASAFAGEMGSEAYDNLLRDWINQQTGGLLEDQASQLRMDPRTVLALASTVYYRDRWDEAFDPMSTQPGEFHLSGTGETMTCDFMHRSGGNCYYWGDRFGAVGLGLDSWGTMWFLLPDAGVSPEELAGDSQVMELLRSSDQWENQKKLVVNFAVPKFDVSSDLDLIAGLKDLGITAVFDGNRADFSPVTTQVRGITLSQAQHAARVSIDEEGITAVAYTVLMGCGAGMPPEEKMDFVLDRPFLFAVTGHNGLPLFVGIVNTPVGA